jgi:hypothetical protein
MLTVVSGARVGGVWLLDVGAGVGLGTTFASALLGAVLAALRIGGRHAAHA